jgi:hypothetical protein
VIFVVDECSPSHTDGGSLHSNAVNLIDLGRALTEITMVIFGCEGFNAASLRTHWRVPHNMQQVVLGLNGSLREEGKFLHGI